MLSDLPALCVALSSKLTDSSESKLSKEYIFNMTHQTSFFFFHNSYANWILANITQTEHFLGTISNRGLIRIWCSTEYLGQDSVDGTAPK